MPRATSQLFTLAFMVVVFGLVLSRRMRPQPVRPPRILFSGVVIALSLCASLAATGSGLLSDRPALLLIPVFIAAGAALGYLLVRTMTFWVHESGEVWMRGGAFFALILIGTIALRFAARAAVTGSISGPTPGQPQPHGFLYDLSADLLFLSLGLWGVRALLIVQRHRRLSADHEPA